jgi:hypothetical protein
LLARRRIKGLESFIQLLMFCPQCKSEYRAGFAHCTDCGVALQTSVAHAKAEATLAASSHPEASAVLWSGQDPVLFSVVLSALDEEGIFYKEFQRRDYAAALSQPFALGYYGLPHWEVRVCATDLSAAQKIAKDALRPVSALAVETNWENESENSGREAGEVAAPPKQMQTPVKIWPGVEVHRARELSDALFDGGIRCWIMSSFPAGEELLVCEEDAARAREIVRGVMERTSAA